MADTRITDLAALTGASTAANDQFVLVDISDTSMAASGTDKHILTSELAIAIVANIASGAITSTMIADGTIVNADINASAAIALSKIATIADQTILGNNSGGTGVPLALTASQVRTLLSLVIGTNVQAWDADLDALAGVSTAADTVPYFTGSHAASVATFTGAARTFAALSSQLTQAQYIGTQTINAQSGTTYTLAAGDVSKLVTLSNGSAITLTVPQDSDVTWAVGDWCEGAQLGAGQVTTVAGTGATLRATPGAKARAQYSRFFLEKISANTWMLSGDISA